MGSSCMWKERTELEAGARKVNGQAGVQTGLDHRMEEEREAEASRISVYVVAQAVLAAGAETDELV